jgi:type II secretory pathway component PulF
MNDALQIIYDQSKKKPLKTIVGTLQNMVQSGRTLAEGFARYPHVFNPVYVNLVGAGEASGTLQANLEHLTLQIEKEHEMRQKIQGALMYPLVIMAVAIVMTVGIVVFVLPNITDVFATLDVELPVTTRMLLWIAEVIETKSGLVLLAIFAFVLAIYFVRKIKPLKPFLHTALIYTPVIGTIVRNTNLARLARVMGTMLASGETISDIIPIVKSVLNNARYSQFLETIEKNVKRGSSISQSMAASERFFPLIMQRMTRVGEESGMLGNMMIYLAEFYEQEVDDSMRNLSNMLEPILLLVIGVLVAGLALSIISPIYQVVGNI